MRSTTTTMEEERLGTARLLRLLLLAWMGARLPLISVVAGCGDQTVFHTERRGVIYSPSWPLPYPPALNCSWSIMGARREVITISFRNFDVDDVAARCPGDWLELSSPGWSEQARLCGSVLPSPFISSSGRVTLYFHSQNNSSGQAQGFRLSYIRGHLGQSSCPPDEFLCGNGKCLPLTWKCNGQDECGDSTDERGCSPPPTDALPLLRRPPCPPGSSPCTHGPSTLCLPPLLRCDGRHDCPDGSDERGCADTACGRKRLGNFYGSFASPDFYFRVNRSVAGKAVGGEAGGAGGGEGGGEVRCAWFLDTQDPKPIVLQLDLRLGLGDSLHVYDGLVQRAERLLQALSHHNNHRPALLESTRGQMSVLYMAQPHSLGRGFNATYQVKGYCFPGEHPCGGDQGCYSDRQRCDGYWHCPSGRDEEGCPACPAGEYPCEGSGGRIGIGSGSSTCYPTSERCNNQKRCPEGSDEKNCFDCQPGNFHCGTNLCIFETWRCDGQEDCLDGSDERDCLATVPRKVITAALIGSLVCGLLLVVALGCAFKLYSLRNREYRAFETQMTRLEAEFVQREAPPSYGQLIAQGLIPPVDDFPVYNPVQSSVLQNLRTAMRRQMRRHSSRRSASRRRLGRLWTRLFQQRGGATRPHGGRGHGIPLLSPPSAPPPPITSPTPLPPSLTSDPDTWPHSPGLPLCLQEGRGSETPDEAGGELRLVGVTSVATPSPCSVAALELALSLPQFSSDPPTPSSSSCSSSFSSSPPLSPLRSSSESQEEDEFELRREARSLEGGERANGRRGGGFEPPASPQRGDCRALPTCGLRTRPPHASSCSSSAPSPSHSSTTPSHYHPLHPRHRRKASKRLVVGLAVNLTSVSLRRYSPLRHISPISPTAETADSV